MHALCSSVPSSRYISWFVSRVPHSFPTVPTVPSGEERTERETNHERDRREVSEAGAKRVRRRNRP